MEVCFEVCLEEDHINAMSVLTTPTIVSTAFSARSSNHDSDKNKPIPVYDHYKEQWHTQNQCWKLHGCPQEVRNDPPMRNRTQNVPILVKLPLPALLNQLVLLQAILRLRLWVPLLSQDMSSGRTIGTARHSKELYILDDDTSCSSLSRTSLLSSYFSTSEQDCMLWHFRLGHPNFTYMQYLFSYPFSKLNSLLYLVMCVFELNNNGVSFSSQSYKLTQPFILIHNDIWGPSKVTTSSGKWWFVTFIDDHTRLTWVYLITDKSEVSSIFQNFYHIIKTQSIQKL
ncbi:hypothetical protein IC582_005004 [Cucumis melo]